MATRVKQVALKDFDGAVQAALLSVNTARNLKLKGPIINGIIIKPEILKNLTAEAVAKDITTQVAASVKDLRLTPKVVIGDGIITVGFIMREQIARPL